MKQKLVKFVKKSWVNPIRERNMKYECACVENVYSLLVEFCLTVKERERLKVNWVVSVNFLNLFIIIINIHCLVCITKTQTNK